MKSENYKPEKGNDKKQITNNNYKLPGFSPQAQDVVLPIKLLQLL